MSWLSVLPEQFAYIEWWITRIFFMLGALIAAPWILLIVYDFFTYAFRVITYEVPYVGGRARNRPRPRAPSLSERPDGEPRQLGLPATAMSTSAETAVFGEDGAEAVQRIVMDGKARLRRTAQNLVEDRPTEKQL